MFLLKINGWKIIRSFWNGPFSTPRWHISFVFVVLLSSNPLLVSVLLLKGTQFESQSTGPQTTNLHYTHNYLPPVLSCQIPSSTISWSSYTISPKITVHLKIALNERKQVLEIFPFSTDYLYILSQRLAWFTWKMAPSYDKNPSFFRYKMWNLGRLTRLVFSFKNWALQVHQWTAFGRCWGRHGRCWWHVEKSAMSPNGRVGRPTPAATYISGKSIGWWNISMCLLKASNIPC